MKPARPESDPPGAGSTGGADGPDAFEVFHAALELPPEERPAFLAAACPDAERRRAVERLLRSDAAAPQGFLPGLDRTQRATGARVGGYLLLECLGEGGMGTVWAARQEFPRREVALKLIRSGRLSDAVVRRFEKEVQALGSLQHPGIAQIYDAGTARVEGPGDPGEARGAGREEPYLVMELVRGRPLLEHAEARALDARERLELVARVADAVHHAHQRGVIHRDLKPDNVLVADEESGVGDPRNVRGPLGQPKILDFGIARLADDGGASVTRDGELVGTLSYMSPEQVEGSGTLDERSDVWALGVMAYQLLSGRLPHDLAGLSLPQAQRLLRNERPAPLARHDPRLRGDVTTIVARALEEDPERRYASAAALAEDIRRHLRGAPIRARSDSTLYVLQRGLSRHRIGLAAGALVSVFCVVLALQLRDKQAVAAASDEKVREALESIGQLERFSSSHFQQSPEQREFLVSTLAQRRRLLEGLEADPGERLATARTRGLVGVLGRLLGEPEAVEDLRAAIDEIEELRGSDADAGSELGAEVDTELAMALKEMALVHEQEGDLDRSEAAIARASALEGLSKPWRAALTAHHARLRRARADAAGAMALYREALATLEGEELSFESLGDATRWECLGAIGSMQAERGQLDEAAHTYEGLDELVEKLASARSPVFKAQAVLHLNNMANLAHLRDENETVWPLMERAQALAEELVERAPQHLLFRRNLLTTLLNRGGFEANLGRFAEAREHLARAEGMAAELVRSEPRMPLFRGLRGVLLLNLGKLDMEDAAWDRGAERLAEAAALLGPASAALPGRVEWLAGVQEAGLCRAECLARAGRHEEATRLVGELPLERVDPQGWRALEVYARAVGAARGDQGLAPEDRSAAAEACVEAAIRHVAERIDASGPAQLGPLLARLRDRARYPELLDEPTYAAFLELFQG